MEIKLEEAHNIESATYQSRIMFSFIGSLGHEARLFAIFNSEQTPNEVADILVELAAELEKS